MAKFKVDKGTLLTVASGVLALASLGVSVMTKKNDEENTVKKAAEQAAELLKGSMSNEN